MKKGYCNLTRDARHLAKEVERLNKKIRVSLSAFFKFLRKRREVEICRNEYGNRIWTREKHFGKTKSQW